MRITVMPSPPMRLALARRFASRRFHIFPPGNLLPSNSGAKGGTVNRPCTGVSHRKQTAGRKQGRNVPVHAFFRCSFASGGSRA